MPGKVDHAINNAHADQTLCGLIVISLPPGHHAWQIKPDAAGIEYGSAWDWEHEGEVRITCPACREKIGLAPLTKL